MTLLHSQCHHPLSCKEGPINSQAHQYNMIISEDHILQEELNNLTCILQARIVQQCILSLRIISTHRHPQRTPHTEENILPIINSYSGVDKFFMPPSIRTGTQFLMTSHFLLPGHLNLYSLFSVLQCSKKSQFRSMMFTQFF